MTIEKKVALWTWIFRSLGLIASASVVEQSWKMTMFVGVLLLGASEIKDYYLKKQEAK